MPKKNRTEKTDALDAKPLPSGLIDQFVTGPMTADVVEYLARDRMLCGFAAAAVLSGAALCYVLGILGLGVRRVVRRWCPVRAHPERSCLLAAAGKLLFH